MTEEFEDSQYVTLEEAMFLLQAEEEEIRDLMKKQKLRYKLTGGALKIYRPDLETFDHKELPGLYLLGTKMPE